jgi:hypothetical protein
MVPSCRKGYFGMKGFIIVFFNTLVHRCERLGSTK